MSLTITEDCVNCGVCEPECPINAIVSDTESGNEKWLELNKKYSEIWPNITERKDPPKDSKEHENEENKFEKWTEKTMKDLLFTENIPITRPEAYSLLPASNKLHLNKVLASK